MGMQIITPWLGKISVYEEQSGVFHIYDEGTMARDYNDKSYANIDVYIATMAHDGEWGDDLCCVAFQCGHPNFSYYIWRPILYYELPSIQQPAIRG